MRIGDIIAHDGRCLLVVSVNKKVTCQPYGWNRVSERFETYGEAIDLPAGADAERLHGTYQVKARFAFEPQEEPEQKPDPPKEE